MNQPTIALIFVLSLAVSLLKGVRWTYVLIYLPTLILLNQVASVNLQHVPVYAQYAPMYAILIAIPFRGESMRFRFGLTDAVLVLLVLSAAITGWTTELFETGVNAFRNDLLRLAMPYFLARIVFRDWQARRAAVWVLVGVLAVVGVAALIECRLTPYFYLHVLQNLRMGNSISPMAYHRFGFFRVAGTVDHPIFFGNMCLVLLGMVAVLARTAGLSLSNKWVAAALLAAVSCVGVSISFTPYLALIAGVVSLAVLVGVPASRPLLLPATVAAVLLGFAYTAYTATSTLGEKGDSQFEGSLYTRKQIIRGSWKQAVTAGPFGHGLRADFHNDDDFDLASVDNSYLQFTMTRGWVYTGLWILLGVTFAGRVGRAFSAVTDPAQVFPLAASVSTVLALMLSMYTVFAGALYTVVWVIMLGLGNTLADQVIEAAQARAAAARGQALGRLRPPVVRMPGGAGGRLGLARGG